MKKTLSAILAAAMVFVMAAPVFADGVTLPTISLSKTDEIKVVSEDIEAPENENPLTGLADLDEAAIGKRPVAVMINNHPDSYPQYNIGKADLVFEVVVEHDLTRLMALFADYQNVPYLVSVRSYRYYFPQLSQGYDAYYIHWGEDLTMMDFYHGLGMDAYDGISNEFLFGRDQDRLDWGYSLEHTSCLYGDRIPQQIEWDGLRTDIKDELKGAAFNFVPFGTVKEPSGDACSFADIQFGNQTAQFVYDEADHTYRKFALGYPHMDGISEEQLAFENVFILYTNISGRDDEADRRWLSVLGSKDDDYTWGYYISEGKSMPVRWEKESEDSRLKFFDLDGKEIQINRGKSYIAFTYFGSATISSEVPEEFQ